MNPEFFRDLYKPINLGDFGDQPSDYLILGILVVIAAPAILYRSRIAADILKTKWRDFRGQGIVNTNESFPPDSPLR